MPDGRGETVYDPVHGWLGLRTHHAFRFFGQGKAAAAGMVAFLRSAGMTLREGSPSRIRLEGVRFDAVLVADIEMSRTTMVWERADPAAQRRFMFLMVSRGAVEVSGDGPQHDAPDGGILIVFPGSTPVELHAQIPSELLVFTFDAGEVSPLVLDPENVSSVLSPGSSIIRSAYAYLHTLARNAESLDDCFSPIARTLTREVARALVEYAGGPEEPGTFARAHAIIAQEHRDAGLTPARLAAELGVSRSSLGRAFADRGTVVAGELRRHRARTARRLLHADPGIPAHTLAERSGFGSSTTLHRALLAEFDIGLADLRRVAMNASSDGADESSPLGASVSP